MRPTAQQKIAAMSRTDIATPAAAPLGPARFASITGPIANADRAWRAEKALLAYIDAAGDDVGANGADTWAADLLCDLRHLAAFLGFEFNPEAGAGNFEAETVEDPHGSFTPSAKWYIEGAAIPKRKSRKAKE